MSVLGIICAAFGAWVVVSIVVGIVSGRFIDRMGK